MKRLLLLLCLLSGLSVAAQKRELIMDKDAVIARAHAELDAAMAEGGSLHEHIVRNNWQGHMLARISFRDKGDITSVFVVDFQGEVAHQNAFRAALHEFRFAFKTPKGKQYRLEKHFHLDH